MNEDVPEMTDFRKAAEKDVVFLVKGLGKKLSGGETPVPMFKLGAIEGFCAELELPLE